jgi:hypothetical protein
LQFREAFTSTNWLVRVYEVLPAAAELEDGAVAAGDVRDDDGLRKL